MLFIPKLAEVSLNNFIVMKGEVTTRQPDDREFEEIKKLVGEFWLDNRNMLKKQFRIVLYKGKLAGFGRIRENDDATELCSLGVIKELRLKGLGKAMVKALVATVKTEIYLVTVIPEFFSKAGFKETKKYPESIKRKERLCTTEYHVGEEYKVMKWERKNS
jgi:N-acetylglutamate synthase-like GNAT family acetyltransferase